MERVLDYISKKRQDITNEHLALVKPYFSTMFPYIELDKLTKVICKFWDTILLSGKKPVDFTKFMEYVFPTFSIREIQTIIFNAHKVLYNIFVKESNNNRRSQHKNNTYMWDWVLKYVHENTETWIGEVSEMYVKLLKRKLREKKNYNHL